MDEAGVKVIMITFIGRRRTNCCFMTTFIDVLRTFDKNGWVFDSFFSFFFQIWEKLEVSFIAQTHAKIDRFKTHNQKVSKSFVIYA